jgi:BrnA antitoxin of type II toxin-antitoxin system
VHTIKTRITIRLDDDILQWFNAQVHAAGGGNYQTLIDTALREHVERSREPLEDTLRRVIREDCAGRDRRPTRRLRGTTSPPATHRAVGSRP